MADDFMRIARLLADLADGRETPEALSVMAAMDRGRKPLDDLVAAVASRTEHGTDAAEIAVQRARLAFERQVGEHAVGDMWDDVCAMASALVLERRKHPPKLGAILDGFDGRGDVEYEMGLLGGLHGTWHRLWSLISSERFFATKGVKADPTAIPDMRREFEGLLGRAMSPAEWERLTAHAHAHCDEVLIPTMDKKHGG